MKRDLLTGMSGTGKSSVIRELAGRGYKAIDADYGYSETGPDGDWIWCEDRIHCLLSTEDADVLFLSGCATNQGGFYAQFDHIILLSAPADVIVSRLASRTTNSYGKTAEELAQVLHDLEAVEPLLRVGADAEIDASLPLDQVVTAVLRIVEDS